MPWESAVYFSPKEEKKIRTFLKSQGLDENQIESVTQWHMTILGSQVSIWSLTMVFVGFGAGMAFSIL